MHRFYAYADKHNNPLPLVLHAWQLQKRRKEMFIIEIDLFSRQSTYEFLLVLFFEFLNEVYLHWWILQEISVDSEYHQSAHWHSLEQNNWLHFVDCFEFDHHDINEGKHFLNSERTRWAVIVRLGEINARTSCWCFAIKRVGSSSANIRPPRISPT